MGKRRRAPLKDVLRGPHWRGLRLEAEDALADGRVTIDGIHALDRWLLHAGRHNMVVPVAGDVLSFFADSVSPVPISTLWNGFVAIAPGHPHLPAISQARQLRRQAYQPAKPVRARSRTPKVSVEFNQLPQDMRDAVAAMEVGEHRGCAAPADSIRVTIAMKLRQLGHSAQAAGLPIDLTVPALSAYCHAMVARQLEASTIGSTLAKLRTYATYVGAPGDVIAAIADEQLFHEKRARGNCKKKDTFLHETGRSLEDVARVALRSFVEAHDETNPSMRHHGFMRAALFGFVICRPLRPLDVHRLVIGRHLQRDSEGWGLYAKAKKNRYKLIGRIWDICTPYLDAAILLGTDEEHLWDAYARAEGRPFLAGRQGERLSRAWATEQSKRHLGAGIGIVRTLWHDHCASVGTDRAVTIALAICGQHDPRTTRHYRTEAGKRTRIDQAQDLVEAAAEACMEAVAGEARSPRASSSRCPSASPRPGR